jgi:hypothetical protein
MFEFNVFSHYLSIKNRNARLKQELKNCVDDPNINNLTPEQKQLHCADRAQDRSDQAYNNNNNNNNNNTFLNNLGNSILANIFKNK